MQERLAALLEERKKMGEVVADQPGSKSQSKTGLKARDINIWAWHCKGACIFCPNRWRYSAQMQHLPDRNCLAVRCTLCSLDTGLGQ